MSDPDPDTETDASNADPGDAEGAGPSGPYVVVLDVLPNGRPDDGRPGYQKSPVAYGIGVESFRPFEIALSELTEVSVGDRFPLDDGSVTRYRDVDVDDLTRNAAAEIEYAVEAIVAEDERRFVDFFNEAGPLTLRLHQLDLLPGIGETLRNKVLDARKRGPFESFEDVTDRVSGLHRPREVLIERILAEIREDELKYRIFARRRE
ncbi:DUF655 domain-containing protein [Halorubrum vacuolatum]|uniref:Putative nucleotide binding protein n=1 Tax=Halorubrum vacuolatum TaxID=63740 RepID=A0A238XNL7_HALVU|nr:DUF655 domain-containing protein [Halorubrum vacuolatum]SNR60290.1 putative nucleotide binding protein [Halorubrum vacuolatum]